jgi:hypothetical protein
MLSPATRTIPFSAAHSESNSYVSPEHGIHDKEFYIENKISPSSRTVI